MNKQLAVAVGLSSAISLAAGSCAGYFAARMRMEKLYSKLAAEEIEEAKKFYSAMYKRPPFETPGSAKELMIPVETAAQALQNYQGIVDVQLPDSETVVVDEVVHNVFEGATDVDPEIWDEIIASRTEDEPYVVSIDEFLEAEPGFNQVTLTYYVGDDVLADERDKVVEKVDYTIGKLNKASFGVMSKDPNVLYVRNHTLELDFEILRSEGSYGEEVLGFTPGRPHAKGR